MLIHLRRNLVAYLALFVALGGTSYAAIKLPANSVGQKQIKPNAVTSAKVKNGSLLLRDLKPGEVPAGPRGAQGVKGDQGLKGDQGPPGDSGDLQRISEHIGAFAKADAPADPTATVLSRTEPIHRGGIYDVSVAQGVALTCPPGPGCDFAAGLYVDDQPIADSWYRGQLPPISGGFSRDCSQGGVAVSAGALVTLTAGSHTFAVKYKQTAGNTATVEPCDNSYAIDIQGPFVQ